MSDNYMVFLAEYISGEPKHTVKALVKTALSKKTLCPFSAPSLCYLKMADYFLTQTKIYN